MRYSVLPFLLKHPHHFAQTTIVQSSHSAELQPKCLQMLLWFCMWKTVCVCISIQIQCNHATLTITNANLEAFALVTLVRQRVTLSIICTTSTVICIQKRREAPTPHTTYYKSYLVIKEYYNDIMWTLKWTGWEIKCWRSETKLLQLQTYIRRDHGLSSL